MQRNRSNDSVGGRNKVEDEVIESEAGRQPKDAFPIFRLAGHFVDGLRKALDIARGYPSYGYSAVFGGVYRVL